MPRYEIVEWNERYEVDDKGCAYKPGRKARAGPLEYIRLKVHGKSMGLGWRKLIAAAGKQQTPAVFGIFCKLLEIAGDGKREDRGHFEDTKETSLAFVLGLEPKQVHNALSVLLQIGWIASDGQQKEERSKEEQPNTTQHNSTQPSGEFPEIPGIPGEQEEMKRKYLDFVLLTDTEHRKLVEEFGEQGTEDRIQELNDGIGSKGYKYKSHYHTILSWERKHKRERPVEQEALESQPTPKSALDLMDEMYGPVKALDAG